MDIGPPLADSTLSLWQCQTTVVSDHFSLVLSLYLSLVFSLPLAAKVWPDNKPCREVKLPFILSERQYSVHSVCILWAPVRSIPEIFVLQPLVLFKFSTSCELSTCMTITVPCMKAFPWSLLDFQVTESITKVLITLRILGLSDWARKSCFTRKDRGEISWHCLLKGTLAWDFSLIVFGGPKALFCIFFSPLSPFRGQPTVKYHPRWQPSQEL
jgi:hypothetical protein